MGKRILALMLTLFVTACSRYETWDANFIGINRSSAKVIVIVDGIELGALLPTSTANFMTTITSGRRMNSGTGPSSNRTSTVSVVFKNTMTGKLSNPIFCTAGERMKTTVTYDTTGGYESPGCYAN